jgi:hypothetical protein
MPMRPLSLLGQERPKVKVGEGPLWVDCVEKVGRRSCAAGPTQERFKKVGPGASSLRIGLATVPFVAHFVADPPFSTQSVESGHPTGPLVYAGARSTGSE